MIPALNQDKTTYAAVAAHIRAWIVSDELAPGTALPKQTELAARFAVSSMTVTRAMRELQDDGLVVAIRRAGSFVAQAPPHTHRFALILPTRSTDYMENRFFQALVQEAQRLNADTDRTIVPYYTYDPVTSPSSIRQLHDDLDRHRLAGVIFASPPFLLDGHPVLYQTTVPLAAIMNEHPAYPQVAKVSATYEHFLRRALERLAAQGRKRVGALVNGTALAATDQILATHAPTVGLETRPEWVQGCYLPTPACGARALELMLKAPAHDRPDALIIADDNLLGQAARAILASGVQFPHEMSVVAQCNFPWQQPAVIPVDYLGYDAAEHLEMCLEAIDQQRRGEGIPAHRSVEVLFQDEYLARRHARSTRPPLLTNALS